MRYDHLVVRDGRGQTLAARMSVRARELRLEVEDADAVWPVTIDPTIAQQAYLKASNTGADDEFGRSVAVSGDTVVVGAPFEDSGTTGVNSTPDESATKAGAAYVFAGLGNTAPTITPAAALARTQGSAATNSTIATVSDTSAGTLTVTATSLPTGITVTGIINSGGTVTADVAAGCTAATGANTVGLTVTNATTGLSSTANLTVNVAANPQPTLSYNNASVNAGTATTVNPATGPTDNGSVSTIVVQSVSPSTSPATITVNNSTGVVSVPNNIPAGSYTVTIRATDNCGLTRNAAFTLTVNNTNTAPTITANNQTRQQGNQPTNVQIATVLDAEDAENTLAVTVNAMASATVNGVTISNLTVNAAGQVRADLTVTWAATNASFTLVVNDSVGATANATLQVTVPANTAPAIGNYPNTTVLTGGTITVTPDVAPTDNNTVVSVTATAVSVPPGTSFTGTFAGNTSSGGVTITNADPPGAYTVTVTLTDNCNATTTRTFTLTVNSCGATLSKPRELFTANGGNDSFTVTINAGCPWTAVSNNPDWINITAPIGTATGSSSVGYTVAINSSASNRSGSITVAGQTFRVFQGVQFGDVPSDHPFYEFIGKLSALGITAGCGGGLYCPDQNTTREQMAIFIERGSGVTNPPLPQQQTFADVPPRATATPSSKTWLIAASQQAARQDRPGSTVQTLR